jgi:hypothetical protein
VVTKILAVGIAALTLGLLAGVLSAPERYAYQPNPGMTQPAVEITSDPTKTPSATKPATTTSRSERATSTSSKTSQVTVKVKKEEKGKGNQGNRGERADKKKRQQ